MLLIFAAMILGLACQTAEVIDFKKYQSEADVPRISVEDSRKEVDAGKAVIVDSRAESAYKAEHIAGSINVTSDADDQLAKIPKGKKIIVYCS